MLWERRPKKEELQSIQEATQAADPTAFSTLPLRRPKDERRTLPGHYPVVSAGGEEFANIETKDDGRAETEVIVSRLLKGIMNVADVVPGRGMWWSRPRFTKIMPLDRVEQSTNEYERDADFVLLSWLFGDSDHSVYNNTIFKNGKASYHDFEEAYEWFFTSVDKKLVEFADMDKVLSYAVPKAQALKERITGTEGERFMRSVTKGLKLKTAFNYHRPKKELRSVDLPLLVRDHLEKRIDIFLKKAYLFRRDGTV